MNIRFVLVVVYSPVCLWECRDSTFEGYGRVENICKSCGDMTDDSLSGVCHLETRMQVCRKPVSMIAVFRVRRIIHAKQTCRTHTQCVGHRHRL